MAKNYEKLASSILEYVGGENNVQELSHCLTRLRFILRDESKFNKKGLETTEGVIKVVVTGGQHQVVIGTDVGDVYEVFHRTTSIKLSGLVDADDADDTALDAPKKKQGIFEKIVDIMSSVIAPILPPFMAAGLIKGLLVMCTTLGWLDGAGTTYTLLYAISDSIFYFLPIFLGYTAAKKFNAAPFVSMAVAAALVYPDVYALYAAGTAVTLFGIPVTLIPYTSSILPIMFAVWGQSKIEKFLNKRLPQFLRGLITPVISLFVTTILTYLIIGPVMNLVSTAISNALYYVLTVCPAVAGALLGGFFPIILTLGLHLGLFPIIFNNIAVYGYDVILPITMGTNFAFAGAAIGVWLKTKNSDLKQITASGIITVLVGGVSEPVIYSVLLKYKRPLIMACIVNGLSGIVMAVTGSTIAAVPACSILTIPALIALLGSQFAVCLVIYLVGGALLTYFFGFNDKMLG